MSTKEVTVDGIEFTVEYDVDPADCEHPVPSFNITAIKLSGVDAWELLQDWVIERIHAEIESGR
jgi:hypothetical protein